MEATPSSQQYVQMKKGGRQLPAEDNGTAWVCGGHPRVDWLILPQLVPVQQESQVLGPLQRCQSFWRLLETPEAAEVKSAALQMKMGLQACLR